MSEDRVTDNNGVVITKDHDATDYQGKNPLTDTERCALYIRWLTYERDQARCVALQAQYHQACAALQQSEAAWNAALTAQQEQSHARGYSINLDTGAWFQAAQEDK